MVLSALLVGACSDDTTTPPTPDKTIYKEAGPTPETSVKPETSINKEAAVSDGPAVVDCTGKADGFECGTGMICLSSKCASTQCGDKYVDAKNNEECDDGNVDATDGCDACKFGCKADTDCDDKNTCTGNETCDTTAHKCKTGTAPNDGTACTLSAGGSGVCNAGTCVSAGCGNKTVETGEDCDDGNKVDGDGCENSCKFSCKVDADCDDKDACNGKESCDTTTHMCKAGAKPNCDDSKTCTTDTCDPATGCVNTPIDLDKDGKSCDDDCNDNDPAIYKGAPECQDGKDNDCDGSKDEAPLDPGKCWLDPDGDTYAATGATVVQGCTCPAGYTKRDPGAAGQADCREKNVSVNPGQTSYFSVGYCSAIICLPSSPKSFDYNCDTKEEQHWTGLASASCKYIKLPNLPGFCIGAGWIGAAVPACGAKADYKNCSLGLLNTCTATIVTGRVQECR